MASGPVLNERLGEAGWPLGVQPATDSTLVPDEAAVAGRNSALGLSSAGHPFVQKRMGLTMINSSPLSGSPVILGLFGFAQTSGTVTQLIVTDDGKIYSMDDAGTPTLLYSGLTAGTHYPIFTVANNLCFICNGIDAVKFDGSTVTKWGITRPTVGTLSGAAGAAGSPNGTYSLEVTFGNSLTGNESSASDPSTATVTVTNQKIVVSNVPVSSDPQVDTRFIYIKNIATMGQYFRAGTINDNVTTTITLDFVDADLDIPAPTTVSNNPPPANIRAAAYFQGLMFVTDGAQLYYSNILAPEQFNPISIVVVNAQDGQTIEALFSDHEILMILKSDSLWGIFNGNNPTTWDVLQIDTDYGCVAPRTVVAANGYTWWWSRHGVVRWIGAGSVDAIGLKLYGDPSSTVNFNAIAAASAAKDELNSRYLIALPGEDQTRATFILPWNTLIGVLESSEWDPMDVAALGQTPDPTTLIPIVRLGNYKGQVFNLWSSNNDGLPSTSCTFQGTFLAGSSTISSITDARAAFTTAGAGLIERKVTILDALGNVVSPQSPRLYITANDATSITLSGNVANLTVGAVYTYYIAGPDFSWQTPWRVCGLPWHKKRFEYLWVLTKVATYGTSAFVDMIFDYDQVNFNNKKRTFQTAGGQGVWDTAVWDQDIWDNPGSSTNRFRVARTGRAWALIIRNSVPNQPFAFLGVAVQAEQQTIKN